MKVLLVSGYYPPNSIGGAEIVAHRQARLLHRAGIEVRVFTGNDSMRGGEAMPRQSAEDLDGVGVYRVANRKVGVEADFYLGENESIFSEILRDFQPDVVHFHNVLGIGANLVEVAKCFPNKCILTLHDHWGVCFKNTLLRNNLSDCTDFSECHKCRQTIPSALGVLPIRLRRDYVAAVIDSVDTLIAPSRSIRDIYVKAGYAADRIEVISSGIDCNEISPRVRSISSSVEFLCAAYLGEHKGYCELLEAIKILWAIRELRGRWQLKIIGKGHLESRLRREVERIGASSAVAILGYVPRAVSITLVGQADVIVLPSIWPENEPVSLLEGAASGAALLAGAVGGCPEIVKHGVNGLLYDARDPESLAEATKALICTPSLIERFSMYNVDRRAELDESMVVRKLVRLYESREIDCENVRDYVVCGLSTPLWKTIGALESKPETSNGKSIRYIWWEWASRRHRTLAREIWIWSGGLLSMARFIAKGQIFGRRLRIGIR